MASVKRSAATSSKNKLAKTIAKVLHIRTLTGIAPVDGVHKFESHDNGKDDLLQKMKPQGKINDETIWKVEAHEKPDWIASKHMGLWDKSYDMNSDDYLERLALEAIVSKLFASISSVKAAYAQLQYAQSPYDAEEIHAADKIVVSEFKSLSELKQCYLKRQFDLSPEEAILSAEYQELRGVIKTFEIMGRKLESQLMLKDSEITFLREKLEEAKKQNRSREKRLNQSGLLSTLDQLHISGLSPNHFITVLRHTVKSIRSFVRLILDEMKAAKWDIDVAASSIEPDVLYWKPDHKCFAFESFVCREMFSAFHRPYFSLPNESLPPKSKRRQLFFERFTELKSIKPKEYLAQKPRSAFAKFCRAKYLVLVHPRMESSLFGNLSQRNLINSGEFPDTPFFGSFVEMAKRVWLLHCLGFSFDPEASIFQVNKGCRFSEVYMESITDQEGDNASQIDSEVAFSVVPGFRIDKTVIQCQVYLAPLQTKRNR